VGEIHVIDRRIVPNGRRDHFEQSVHFHNLLNHLSPLARDLTHRCRTSSIHRKRIRDFHVYKTIVREKLSIIAQGSLPATARKALGREIERSLTLMDKIADIDLAFDDSNPSGAAIVAEMRAELREHIRVAPVSPLAHLPKSKRAMYEYLFGLVYECSTNRIAAKALIDRIMLKIV